MPALDGRLAILTHAGSEFVSAVAAELGQAGARLVIADEDGALAKRVVATLTRNGIAAVSCQAGLNRVEIEAAVHAVQTRDGIPTILVNLPGIVNTAVSSLDLSEAEFRHTIENSLIHDFLWCQAVGRLMLEHRSEVSSVIVNITALSALGGWPGWLAQSAAFGAVHNLTHTLAAEWANQGVRVNALVSGVTDTLMQEIERSRPNSVLKRIPVGRLATAQDVAKALLYLVHPAASYVSGEILRVDGGWDSWGRLHAVAPKEQ